MSDIIRRKITGAILPREMIEDANLSMELVGLAAWIYAQDSGDIEDVVVAARFGIDVETAALRMTQLVELGWDGSDPGPIGISTAPAPQAVEPTIHVYVVEGGGLVKIGITADVKSRLNAMLVGSPTDIALVGSIAVARRRAIAIEAQAHEYFRGRRVRGEWFRITATEALDFLVRAETEAQ